MAVTRSLRIGSRKAANLSQESGQMTLALPGLVVSGPQEAPVDAPISPDPSPKLTDPLAYRQSEPLAPENSADSRDRRGPRPTGDPTPVATLDAGTPAKPSSTCPLSASSKVDTTAQRGNAEQFPARAEDSREQFACIEETKAPYPIPESGTVMK